MYGNAMRNIVNRLKGDSDIEIAKCQALDFFARDGGWQTVAFASEVGRICAWEIDAQFLPKLRANLPTSAEITMGDSYEIALRPQNRHRFDLVVLDNPQGIFGDTKCEHFEVLPLLPVLAADRAVVVFNVNISPFNYDQHPAWATRRTAYYGRDAEHLAIDFVLDFYRAKLSELGLSVVEIYSENRRPADYLYAVVAKLCRRQNP